MASPDPNPSPSQIAEECSPALAFKIVASVLLLSVLMAGCIGSSSSDVATSASSGPDPSSSNGTYLQSSQISLTHWNGSVRGADANWASVTWGFWSDQPNFTWHVPPRTRALNLTLLSTEGGSVEFIVFPPNCKGGAGSGNTCWEDWGYDDEDGRSWNRTIPAQGEWKLRAYYRGGHDMSQPVGETVFSVQVRLVVRG